MALTPGTRLGVHEVAAPLGAGAMGEVYAAGNGKSQITSSGGVEAQWRGDSKEIFYRDSIQLGSVWAVDVQSAGPTFAVGEPRRLFERSWVVAGHREAAFTEIASEPIAVVTNWAAARRK
jgi:hypothetical protein